MKSREEVGQMNELIIQSVSEVLDKYDKDYSNEGVRDNLRSWQSNKGWLIELLRSHPNWSEEAMAVIFEVEESRDINRRDVMSYKNDVQALCHNLDWTDEDKRKFMQSLDLACDNYEKTIGYYNEHTLHEYVDLEAVEKNIVRISEMISAQTGKFEYIEAVLYGKGLWKGGYYEDWYDFEKYYGQKDIGLMELMPIPDSCYIKAPRQGFLEPDGTFLLDEASTVYEYLGDIEVAVEADGYEAFTENGLPLRFKPEKAIEIEVVTEDYAYDLQLELCDEEDDEEKGRRVVS